MTSQKLDFTLTAKDIDLLKTLRTLCSLDEKTLFSSDDFRLYGLDRFLRDTKNGLGGLFAKWKHNRLIIDTGQRKPSILSTNNMREIKVWKFAEEADSQ